MKSGIEALESSAEAQKLLRGRRVGLITNYTGLDASFRSSIDILKESCELAALFGPEHGIRGEAAAGERVEAASGARDRLTGIPVYSLYGETRKPTPEMLAGLDLLAFDIQDVGLRFYTYLYTMAYAMAAAAESGLPFLVFDRPNPLGGDLVSGNILELPCRSFVGNYETPQRYGLTVGEFASFVNERYGLGCELHVAPLEGWSRSQDFEETGLPWVLPSPNIPTLETAFAYAGTCLFEGTNLSEGRGTAKPFELVGAPWLDADGVAQRMNGLDLPGIRFRPHFFSPSASKYSGETCAGVQLHFEPARRKEAPVIEAAVRLLGLIRELHPDKLEFLPGGEESSHPFIDLIAGSELLRTEASVEPYLESVREGSAAFERERQPYLRYH